MADIVGNANVVDAPSRYSGLLATIFRCYRKNFVLFWCIMVLFIILSLLFEIPPMLTSKLPTSEALWHFDTSRGVSVNDNPKRAGVGWGTHFIYQAFSIDFLWLAMCPLIFMIVQRQRGTNITLRTVWKQTFGNVGAILALFFLLALPGVVAGSIALIVLEVFRKLPVSGDVLEVLAVLIIILLFSAIIYFMVSSSLCNQGIIIEHLRAMPALRRSTKLVRPAWARFFRMYVMLAWATMVLTSSLLGLTLYIFSLTVPEFGPVRDVLLSSKSWTLFLGGHIRISFAEMPNFWTVCVMAVVNTLVHAIVAPVWAILTTYLYLERVGGQPDVIET